MEVHRLLVLDRRGKILFLTKLRNFYAGYKCKAEFEDDIIGRKVEIDNAYITNKFIYLEVTLNEGWLKDLVPGTILKIHLS